MTDPNLPGIVVVDASDPMRGWRRNSWLFWGLALFLLACVFAIAALLRAVSVDNAQISRSNGRLHLALAQADQLRAEKDLLIQKAAKAKPGSPAQTQALKQLVTSTVQVPGTKGDKGDTGIPGLTIVGPAGAAARDGRDGRDSNIPGPAGSPGTAGSTSTVPGPTGSPGTKGDKGDKGDGPSGFSFTTSDGTLYDCTPDGGGHYTCTARSKPTPTPTGSLP